MKKNNLTKIIDVLATVALALGWSAGAVFAQQNMIVNGSFESAGGGFQHFPGWGPKW